MDSNGRKGTLEKITEKGLQFPKVPLETISRMEEANEELRICDKTADQERRGHSREKCRGPGFQLMSRIVGGQLLVSRQKTTLFSVGNKYLLPEC